MLLSHLKHAACSVTAFIFGLFFLTTLFILAVFKNMVATSTPADSSRQLSKEERRLTFDLAYYVGLQGFTLENHDVVTKDGFVLDCHRIVVPETDSNEKPRYPLLLIPGLMQSSSAYCTSGSEAIALVLARLGYDVWLGNNRGGFHPKHVEIKRKNSAKMWDWEMREMATQDVPAMVNYVREQTGATEIAVAAHSQGTTQTFRALAREEHGGLPDLGLSISSFCALAPAVYAGPLVDRWFLRLLRVPQGAYHTLMGYHAFLPIMSEMRTKLPLKFFSYVAYIVFNYMLGWDDKLWDRHYRDRNFIFAPVFVSAKLMFWWLGKNGFAHRKCIFSSEDSKWFDERFPPLQIYACGRDNLVLPDKVINRIHNYEPDVKPKTSVVNLPGYSHLDVIWAMDANSQVALPVAEFVWKHVKDQSRWRTPSLPSLTTGSDETPAVPKEAEAPPKEVASKEAAKDSKDAPTSSTSEAAVVEKTIAAPTEKRAQKEETVSNDKSVQKEAAATSKDAITLPKDVVASPEATGGLKEVIHPKEGVTRTDAPREAIASTEVIMSKEVSAAN